MRALQAVVVFCLALAGLSFSSSVTYTISINDFKTLSPYTGTAYGLPYRVLHCDPLDTLRIVIQGQGNLKTQMSGIIPTFLENPSVSFMGPKLTQTINEFESNGCKDGNIHLTGYIPLTSSYFNPPTNTTNPQNVMLYSREYPTGMNGQTFRYPVALAYFEGSAYGGCRPPEESIQSFYVYRQNGPPDSGTCSIPNSSVCLQCAWPYHAVPDTSGCGCKVFAKQLQSEANLKAQCNAYCNSTSINGNQAYTDWSRSNFTTNGTQNCACSDPITRKTIYRPISSCPNGTSATEQSATDTGLQDVQYDPTTNPNIAGSGSGSGGGTGQFDSSSNRHLSRIDSILGSMNDTNGVKGLIDSIQGKGKYDSAIEHDTSSIKNQIGQIQGDTAKSNTQGWFGGSSKTWRGNDCWQCDTVPDTSIVMDFHVFGTELKDTIRIGISPVMTGLGFDFWPWMRALEWLCIVIVMTPICINIAGGTTGKEAV